MTKTIGELSQLKREAKGSLADTATPDMLEAWRVKYLGRKGAVPLLLREVRTLPLKDRKAIGQAANQLRHELEELYKQKKHVIAKPGTSPYEGEVDPERSRRTGEVSPGHLHPITVALRRSYEIFAAMGFLIVEGPDVEEIRYNFDDLNIPFEHPARAETDTFYIRDHPNLVLRTHVSPLQIRGVLENHLVPPFRMAYFGSSFRSEKEDATHGSLFQQYEFMVVDTEISLADLKGIVQTYYSTFFGREVAIRFRPSYFPFVEPGLEIDMSCVFCNDGCRVCSHTQWLEMAGAGMVHPNVLRNINVDSKKFQGIALGGGLDRLVMLQHAIPDIRLMYSGDIRFLKQFS